MFIRTGFIISCLKVVCLLLGLWFIQFLYESYWQTIYGDNASAVKSLGRNTRLIPRQIKPFVPILMDKLYRSEINGTTSDGNKFTTQPNEDHNLHNNWKETFIATAKPENIHFTLYKTYSSDPSFHKIRKAHRVLVEPDNVAQSNTENTFFVYIFSAPANILRRNIIRQTWANPLSYDRNQPYKLKVVFVLGVASNAKEGDVVQESITYGDVLMLDFVDSYDNLTLKAFHAMTWLSRRLPRVKYFYKTDDDVMLNTFIWIKDLQWLDATNQSRCFKCCVFENRVPFRDSKWSVSFAEYPYQSYPPFCTGTGYLITSLAMHAILQTVYTVRFLKLEDVYITGLVAEKANITRFDVGIDTYFLFENEDFLLLKHKFRLVTNESFSMSLRGEFWPEVVRHQGFARTMPQW